jgi:hypothetical protein
LVTPLARSTARALPERLDGIPLAVARITWIAVALVLAILAAVGFTRAFIDPTLLATPPLTDLFAALGLDIRVMMGAALVTPLVVAVVICLIVFWRRSRDPMALLFTSWLLAMHAFGSRSLLAFQGDPWLEHAISAVFAVAVVLMALVLALFPDGRFVPGTVRWLPAATVVLVVAVPDGGRALMSLIDGGIPADGRDRALVFGFGAMLILGLLAQIHRYRHVSTAAQRQQTKWVLVPLGWLFVLYLGVLTTLTLPGGGGQWTGWFLLAVIPVGIAFPIMLGNAVVRYRLYDIDRLVSRTISYGIVLAVLAGAYGVLVVALRGLLPIEGDLPVAISTLAVAMLFLPLARRVRLTVDRIFFRSHYDSAIVVSHFADELTHRLDPDELTGRTVDIVQRTFQPLSVDVWLSPDGRDDWSTPLP